jgi:hypothetical protein
MENVFYLKNEDLIKLPSNLGKTILKDFISDYEWIKGRLLEEEIAIELLDKFPIEASYIEYGIHGKMAYLKWGNCYWNVFKPELFEDILKEEN